MSIEKELQSYILTKYKSMSQFASAVGIAYTTIKGGLERGIMGMSTQNVIKICQTLDINVYALAEGKIEESKKDATLTAEEFNLINQYRVVDTYGKSLLCDVAKHEYERCISLSKDNLTFLSSKAARSKNNDEPIKQEYIKDLSKIKPDNSKH